ncbi:MAG: hypothetical protein EKK37_17490 [Sphingobacteriales bacterium]|nr:MAG: hypothetical protein EKK37_17490 [Sphingobacteriales bacterium]
MNIAKERIKQFLDFKGITYRKFYEKTGLSNSFLSNNSSIGSDKLEIISIKYPFLNIAWVVTGKGSMEIQNAASLHWGKLIEAFVHDFGISIQELSQLTALSPERIKTLYTQQVVDTLELYKISDALQFDLLNVYNNINGTNYKLPGDRIFTWQSKKELIKKAGRSTSVYTPGNELTKVAEHKDKIQKPKQ